MKEGSKKPRMTHRMIAEAHEKKSTAVGEGKGSKTVYRGPKEEKRESERKASKRGQK